MKLDLSYLLSAPKKQSEEASQSKTPSGTSQLRLDKAMLLKASESPFSNIGGNKIRKTIPPLETVKAILEYDPITGEFFWKESGGSRRRAGAKAGAVCGNGYRYIGIGKERYIAAHLAWYITYSEWPTQIVDHINGDKADDAIDNLRLIDKQGNAENNRSKERPNYGVYKCRNKYKVQLYIDRRHTHFGVFDTIEEAREVAAKLRIKYGI